MWRLVVGLLIRVTVSATVLLAVYCLVPTKGSGDDSDLPWLILDLVIFGLVVAVQVPVIVKAKYPRLRAVEALAVTVPLFLLIFSRIYLSNSLTDPAAFTLPGAYSQGSANLSTWIDSKEYLGKARRGIDLRESACHA
jgi:voltage-gated potassium channel